MFEGRFNLQSLQTRSASAIVLIVAVLAILYFGGWAFIGLLTVLAGISLYEWVQLALKCDDKARLLYLIGGVPYVLLSFVCCYFIFEHLGFFWAIIFLLMVWGSDIGAYFTGKALGGPKLAERISPNKTWAGMAGAVVSPALIGFLAMVLYKGIDDFNWMAPTMMMSAGFFIGIAGQGGDLLVSAYKRRAGVKDTGELIPGHGGLLDRIDSMLLAAPVFLLLNAIGHG